jgi:hypothetical protein
MKEHTNKSDKVEVEAIRAFAVDYTKDELEKLQARDKNGRSYAGATKRIEPGQTARISRSMAKKLQKSGVISIAL